MRINDEIYRALQKTVEGFGSRTRFANMAGINYDTLRKYLSRRTRRITEETWDKIFPFIRHHLPPISEDAHRHDRKSLTSNQKILLDAFADLPEKEQDAKLMEIVEAARTELQKKNSR